MPRRGRLFRMERMHKKKKKICNPGVDTWKKVQSLGQQRIRFCEHFRCRSDCSRHCQQHGQEACMHVHASLSCISQAWPYSFSWHKIAEKLTSSMDWACPWQLCTCKCSWAMIAQVTSHWHAHGLRVWLDARNHARVLEHTWWLLYSPRSSWAKRILWAPAHAQVTAFCCFAQMSAWKNAENVHCTIWK